MNTPFDFHNKNRMNIVKFKSIDEYHSAFPEAVREKLNVMRQTIRKAAPKAEEIINYNMPTFKQTRWLVSYAAFKRHIGFYVGHSAIAEFKNELTNMRTTKGGIQFPFDKPLPTALIKKIVKLRVIEDFINDKSGK